MDRSKKTEKRDVVALFAFFNFHSDDAIIHKNIFEIIILNPFEVEDQYIVYIPFK